MNTKQFIEELQKIDPSGELTVCIGNAEVSYIDKVPGYYDGRLEKIIYNNDKTKNIFNVIGAKLVISGDKVRIFSTSLDDVLLENPDLPVEIEGEPDGGYFTNWVEKLRKENREIIESVKKT